MKKNRSDAYTPNTGDPSEAYVTWCGGIQPLPLLDPIEEEDTCCGGIRPLPPLAPMEEDVPEDPNRERILIFRLPDME